MVVAATWQKLMMPLPHHQKLPTDIPGTWFASVLIDFGNKEKGSPLWGLNRIFGSLSFFCNVKGIKTKMREGLGNKIFLLLYGYKHIWKIMPDPIVA